MPALTNPRHEAFCRAIVAQIAGKAWTSQGAAYVAAGYDAKGVGEMGGSAECAASRLLNKVKTISARISELQEQAAKKKKVTTESIVDELEEARTIAKEQAQASAMVAASATKAKVLGLQVDRVEQGKPGDFTQSQDRTQLAISLLRQAGYDSETVSGEMAQAALAALDRFQGEMSAIVSGEQPQSLSH